MINIDYDKEGDPIMAAEISSNSIMLSMCLFFVCMTEIQKGATSNLLEKISFEGRQGKSYKETVLEGLIRGMLANTLRGQIEVSKYRKNDIDEIDVVIFDEKEVNTIEIKAGKFVSGRIYKDVEKYKAVSEGLNARLMAITLRNLFIYQGFICYNFQDVLFYFS